MSGRYNLSKTTKRLNVKKADRLIKVPASLGIPASFLVEVSGREGYHYARIRGNLSELVQVYNPITTPVYDMPVLITFRNRRWEVDSIDAGRYITWGQNSPTVPIHGSSHFISNFDPVFITTQQIVDSLVYSLSTGITVHINAGLVSFSNDIVSVQSQNINLINYVPTGTGAIWAIVRVNSSGTASIQNNMSYVDSVTQLGYYNVPTIDIGYIPLAAVKLWYGQTSLSTSDIVDLRYLPDYDSTSTGTVSGTDEKVKVSSDDTTTGYLSEKIIAGAGISLAVLDDSGYEQLQISFTGTSTGGGAGNIVVYDDNIFKVTGTAFSFNDGLFVHVTGSVAYIDWTGSAGSQGEQGPPGDNTLLIYDNEVFKVTGTALNFGSNLTVAVTGTTAYIDGSGGSGATILEVQVFS